MDTKFDLTRRSALASMGASAALAASPALAASSMPINATLEAVTVVWPAYHRAGLDKPRIGEAVTLRIDSEPYMSPALGIYSRRGLKLGYVAPRKAQKLLAALNQGARLEARVAADREDDASSSNEAGWYVAKLSVTTEQPSSFA